MANPPIANQIRTLRFMAGEMTQADLGDRVGVTRQTIGLIEGGGYNPTLQLCIRLARATGKSLDNLFWNEGEE